MKHNLLRNFLALVLSGIMLAGVGCKNYDDDIDKINNRLDELYVTVADLDEQIESVRNAIPSLDALNEEVAALRSELDGVKTDVASIDQKLEAIGDVQAKLNELSQELKDYVNGAIQSSEETLRNELATKGAVSELEALIEGIQEDYKAELEEINNKLTELEGTVGELPAVDFSGDIQDLKDRLAALEGSAADAEALADLTGRVEALEGIKVLTESDVNTLIDTQIKELLESKPWLGESLDNAIANYLETNEYITKEALNGYATYDETLAKLIAEMKTGQGKYVEELIAFIQANQTQIDANELQILVDGNQKKMSELMNEFSERLYALENRIQSLVYVPSSLTETTNLIPVTPAPYIDFGKDGKEYLGDQTLEMTFRVSPASLADKIVKEGTVSIITRKVSMSSTNSPAFTVESVTASEQNEGEFTVKATTDYKFGSENDETLAIALNVKIAGATTGSEGEQTTHQGIDYTTSFLGLKYTGNGACINDALRIVKVDEDGKLVASLSNGLYSSSLKYNDYSVVNFLEGFDVYYYDGKKYMPLSEMWEGVLESSRSAFDAKKITINSANEKSYKVTAESVQIDEANLPTTDTDLIGDNITSSKVTFTVALGEKSLEIGEAQHKVTVVSNGVETGVPQTAIAWNHTKASSKVYEGKAVDLEPNISVDHYKEMKTWDDLENHNYYLANNIEVFNSFMTENKWIVYVANKNTNNIVANAYVVLNLTSTPTAENDVQRITPTFYGMTFAEGGEYIAYAKFVHSDKTTTTITIPVTASGAPEISYEISKEVMYVGTSTYTVAENFAEALWNDNYKEAFGSKEAFLGVVAAMTATTGEDEATLSVAGNDITVTFPTEYEFKIYSSTLTLADKSGLEIVIPAEIELKEASAELTPNPLFVTNGRVNAIAEFNADGSRYDVVAQPLGNAYTYEEELDDVAIRYEINREQQGDKLDEMAENGQIVPQIDDQNKLIWNDWDALELKVDAYLVFTNSNEEVKGSRVTFTVAIDSPYADDKITVATKGNEFELSQDASFKVAQLLTLNSTYQSGDPAANTNVFDASTEDGLHANLAKALGGEVKYETTFSNVNFAFDEETGVITYTGEDSSLKPVSQTIEVKVTYTNNFGVEFAPVTVQIKTK